MLVQAVLSLVPHAKRPPLQPPETAILGGTQQTAQEMGVLLRKWLVSKLAELFLSFPSTSGCC